MSINLSNLSPIAFAIGPLEIRWYSLAYIFGILFVSYWIKKCNNRQKIMSLEAYDNWLVWAVLSILLGGRLGYVLFYNLPFFLANPLEIFAFWHGGMSFHGGLVGSIFGMWLFAKKYNINFMKLMDVIAVAAPVGIFFGRLANFVNLELYGRVTNSKFGIIFPNAGSLARHPSQLYEASLEGILLFIILFYLYSFTKVFNYRGMLSGLFLIFYGLFRMLIENFREPDEQIGFLFAKITMGQLLSLPLIFLGIVLVFYRPKKKNF